MKITIERIPPDAAPEIIIRCHEEDDSIRQLMDVLHKPDKRLVGVADSKLHLVHPQDVYYFESVDSKVFMYCEKRVYESKLKLYEIESACSGLDFFRATKSTVLNIAKISSVHPLLYGRFEARLHNGEKVYISRQFVPVLKNKLGL